MRRNNNIDALKFLLAILIIFLHINSDKYIYLKPVTQCAVPSFFMISGYCIYTTKDFSHKLLRAAKRIAMICLWVTIPFAIMHYSELFAPLNLFRWFAFNACPIGAHLWYLYAYLYVLVILGFCPKKWQRRIILYSPLLFIVPLAIGNYRELLWGGGDWWGLFYYRNFLFIGFPSFCLGLIIKRYSWGGNMWLSLALIITFTVTSIIEMLFLQHKNAYLDDVLYFSTNPLAVCLLLFATTATQLSENNLLVQLGRKHSLYIYIFHLPILNALCKILGPISELMTSPLIVLALTLLASSLFIYIKQWLYKSCIIQKRQDS